MRRDSQGFFHEEYDVFSYKPQLYALMYGLRHSGLYQGYHCDMRQERLDELARQEPELAFVLACVGEMGLFEDCAEVCIWREICKLQPNELLQHHRDILPGIVESIRARADGKEKLREMYFSKILPVVVAMDAGEIKIACCVYGKLVEELEKQADES